MKITTKYRLMLYPVAIAAFPLGVILYLLAKLAAWYGELIVNYKGWCEKKSRKVIRYGGHWIYNPEYLEEKEE